MVFQWNPRFTVAACISQVVPLKWGDPWQNLCVELCRRVLWCQGWLFVPGVVWKTPESIARTVMLCFPEGSASWHGISRDWQSIEWSLYIQQHPLAWSSFHGRPRLSACGFRRQSTALRAVKPYLRRPRKLDEVGINSCQNCLMTSSGPCAVLCSSLFHFVAKEGWGANFCPVRHADCFWSWPPWPVRHSLLVLNLAATGLTCHRRILERRSFSQEVQEGTNGTMLWYNSQYSAIFWVLCSASLYLVLVDFASNPKWVEVSPATLRTLRIQRSKRLVHSATLVRAETKHINYHMN